jgi:hypothetical protein
VSSAARNWIAIAVAVVLAQLAIPMLDDGLFALFYDITSSEYGVEFMNLAWLLAHAVVYLACTLVLLKLIRDFRHLRWVVAFGAVGSVVAWSLVWWMVFRAIQAGAQPLSMWKSQPFLLGNVLDALAPLVGAVIGWPLWRRSSRPAAPVAV